MLFKIPRANKGRLPFKTFQQIEKWKFTPARIAFTDRHQLMSLATIQAKMKRLLSGLTCSLLSILSRFFREKILVAVGLLSAGKNN